MKIKILNRRDALLSTFWFVPTLIALGSVGLSFAMIALHSAVQTRLIESID